MTKKEFAQIIMALRTYYPRENLIPNDQAAELWFYQLQDLDFKTTEAALNAWVATNKWSPSIAEIRAEALSIRKGEIPDWGEAWEKVRRAIHSYGFYNQPEAMASLDDLTRECVRRLGWREICHSETPEVTRANFRIIYENTARRRAREAQLPPQFRAIMETLRETPVIEEKTTRTMEEIEAAAEPQEADPVLVSDMVAAFLKQFEGDKSN